jgi:signal transduction histidine kinase
MNKIREEQIIEITIFTCIAFLILAVVIIVFFYFSRKKIIKIQINNKNREIDYQKQLVRTIIITQESERKRIAQDLHDDISSKLNIISLNTQLLKRTNLPIEKITEIVDNIISNTKTVSDDSRRIAHDLLPPVIQNFGLHAGIEELCFDLSFSKTVNAICKGETKFDCLPIDKQLQVFRILQELTSNSIKHGKAKNITIDFSEGTNFKKMIYLDDGLGFNLHRIQKSKGLGMKNIESRVNFLEAEMKINSNVNGGIKFELIFEL